jgi:hypothetical protein
MSQEHDKIIELVQSSTRSILGNYRKRAELLRESSEDDVQIFYVASNYPLFHYMFFDTLHKISA